MRKSSIPRQAVLARQEPSGAFRAVKELIASCYEIRYKSAAHQAGDGRKNSVGELEFQGAHHRCPLYAVCRVDVVDSVDLVRFAQLINQIDPVAGFFYDELLHILRCKRREKWESVPCIT